MGNYSGGGSGSYGRNQNFVNGMGFSSPQGQVWGDPSSMGYGNYGGSRFPNMGIGNSNRLGTQFRPQDTEYGADSFNINLGGFPPPPGGFSETGGQWPWERNGGSATYTPSGANSGGNPNSRVLGGGLSPIGSLGGAGFSPVGGLTMGAGLSPIGSGGGLTMGPGLSPIGGILPGGPGGGGASGGPMGRGSGQIPVNLPPAVGNTPPPNPPGGISINPLIASLLGLSSTNLAGTSTGPTFEDAYRRAGWSPNSPNVTWSY